MASVEKRRKDPPLSFHERMTGDSPGADGRRPEPARAAGPPRYSHYWTPPAPLNLLGRRANRGIRRHVQQVHRRRLFHRGSSQGCRTSGSSDRTLPPLDRTLLSNLGHLSYSNGWAEGHLSTSRSLHISAVDLSFFRHFHAASPTRRRDIGIPGSERSTYVFARYPVSTDCPDMALAVRKSYLRFAP